MDGKSVADACKATGDAVRESLAWISDARNAKKVSQERGAMEQKVRRVAAETARLERSAMRPTCVGVFGASQHGKSYLISTLARKAAAPLIASFDGARSGVNFIEEINPVGGDESTGVVTRFTIRKQASPSGYPVCLKLLNQTDVIKVLVNSYFQDGDHEHETVLDASSFEAALKEAEANAKPAQLDVFSEADVWDLQEYLQKNSGGAAAATSVEPFWDRIAAVAPRLDLVDRAKLLSVLWGGHETFGVIFLKLAQALASLGFSQDAFVKIEALIPASASVINVNALDGLIGESAEEFEVAVATGTVVRLSRPLITALVAELRIVCREKPLDFFDHTDLLDFPGYRSRTKTDLKRYFREPGGKAAKELFLRGKVDYLFQRYTSELELTTMILCVKDSVMEVTSLPKAIETWVGMTHGTTPEKRLGKPNLLFFALTMFDRTLELKAGDRKETYSEKFQIRFSASMSPFAKVEPSWVKQWFPNQPTRNVFLVRNPNVPFRGVIDYDGKTEMQINPAETGRLADLKAAFVALPTAIEHFADPAAAWDALMTLNDGGAGRLSQALSDVCVADLKLRQITARLDELRRDVFETLARFHVGDDVEKRREERLAFVDDELFGALNECARLGRFGSALRGMMIDASDLHAALVEALARPNGEAKPVAKAPPAVRGPFGGGKKPPFPPPAADRWEKLAEASLSSWASLLQIRAEDPVFARRVGVDARCLREIAAETGAAARRVDLAKRLAAELRLRSAPSEQNDAIVRKAALIGERLINRFVSELDFDRIAPAAQLERFSADLDEPVFAARPFAFDASGIGVEAPDFANAFMGQWGRAFRTTVSLNAVAKTGTVEEAAQNARLGKILQALAV